MSYVRVMNVSVFMTLTEEWAIVSRKSYHKMRGSEAIEGCLDPLAAVNIYSF